MISTVARNLLARSAFKSGHRYALTSSATKSKALGNILLGQSRFFSVSTRLASPAAAKTTTAKKTATKAAPKKKTVATRKKATASTASKRKTTKGKVAPKKRKVAAKRKVTVTRRKAKKVAPPPKVTPRNDPSLRAPPRGMTSFSLYVKRMWPTLTPKPANATVGIVHVRDMWKSLTEAEKKPFADEALALNEERRKVYEKWRAGLSLGDVKIINAYRSKGKHNKLGRIPGAAPKRPAKGYVKFYQESLKSGTIDLSKAPAGTRSVLYGSKEASKLWKALTPAQKNSYL